VTDGGAVAEEVLERGAMVNDLSRRCSSGRGRRGRCGSRSRPALRRDGCGALGEPLGRLAAAGGRCLAISRAS